MATYGSMKVFNPQAEDWTIYAERLQHHLVANGVEDAGKKRAILLCAALQPTNCCAVWSKAAKWMRNLTTNWSSSWNHTTAPSHLRLCRDFILTLEFVRWESPLQVTSPPCESSPFTVSTGTSSTRC